MSDWDNMNPVEKFFGGLLAVVCTICICAASIYYATKIVRWAWYG